MHEEDDGCAFDADHAAWARFLLALDLEPSHFVALYRVSLRVELLAAALLPSRY
jgi:hypothetical protein